MGLPLGSEFSMSLMTTAIFISLNACRRCLNNFWQLIFQPSAQQHIISSANSIQFTNVSLQGEQCNILPDSIDDIVADLAAEAPEDEGTF